MRFLILAGVLLFSLASYGQSAVRRIASLTNLVAGIDPAAVDTGSKVSYLVDGYYTAGDWGTSAREFTATKTAGTTNFAHLIRSTKNTNYYWRSSDASDPVQDIRKWGAIMSDGLDDSDKVQAAINFCNGQLTVFFPAGVTKLESALTFPADYQRFDAAGFNANIQVAHNGNAFEHLGVTNGQPRRYGLEFRNLRLTTAAGYTPEAAWRVDDVSFSLWENCYVTQGSGVGFNRAWSSFGHYDIPNAIYGGNWGNTIRGGEYYNKAGGDFVIWGSGGPSGTGGPNDLRVLDSYVSGGLSGASTNGATGSIYLNNCNMVRIVNTDMEAFGTNGVWFGTNVQSATVLNNRFELQGGSSATRHCIRFDEYTTQGHVIAGNMMLIQGGGGSGTRIYGPVATPTMVPATIFEPSFEGASQVLADTLLVGTNLDFVARTFGPAGNKLVVMDKILGKTNSVVVGTYDGTVNPRLSMSQIGTNDNRINSGSSAQSIPLSIYGNDLMAWIGPSGSGILGTNRPGNEFTVYGDATFGSDPFNPFIGGWTTTPDLVAIRSAGTNKIGFWAGSIDGIDNRRVEVSVDPVADTATFQHTYSAGGGTTLHKVGNSTVFQLTDSLLTVNTNTTFIPGVTITAGNQVPQSRKEWPVDWVNVLDYGALINSTNDSTPAFQAAVNSGASVVYVPDGSYDFRSTLQITNGVRLVGDHKDTTTIRYFGTNFAIRIGGGTNYSIRGASLENLFIIGWEDPPYSGAYAPSNALGLVHIYGAVRGSLKHLRLSNAMTGTGVLFERRAWYWDVDDVTPFDVKYGIWVLDQNPGLGDLVDTINIQNSVLSGCDWGAVLGDPTVPAGSGERGVAVINFTDTSIEGNRIGGLWINQSELVSLNNTYFEANGRATNGQGVHVRLGNSLDTNAWSASGIRLIGTRWADTTNSVEIYSANNVTIKDNDHQGVKGAGVPIVFMTTNHIDVQVDGDFARQYPSLGYNPPVAWMDGIGSSVTKYTAGPTNGPLRRQSASAEFGDDSGTWMSIDRVFYANRFLSANSTNGTAGIFASRFGATGQARAGAWTDGVDAYIGGGREGAGGGAMPIQLIMNGTRYMTLDEVQTANPNRFVVGATNGYTPLTVHGNIMFGSPTNYGGFSQFDKQLSFISRDQAESIGLVMYSYDGTTNRSLVLGIDPEVGDAFLQLGYSSGGEIPFVIRSSFNNDIVSLIDSGVTIRNGAGLTLGGETITDLTGTGITIVGGALTATSTPYTSFWPDLTNALIAGANVTFSYDTGNETITINSSGGGGGATNGSAVSVDGTYLSALNLADSAELGVTATGTNVTYALVAGSVATNKIDSTFYAWVNSKGGNVYADGTSITNIKSSPSILFTTAAQEVTLALSNTAVTPGTYTTANITVDAQGRITAAANGSASTNSGTVVSVNGVQQGTLNLTNSSKIAGTLAGTNLSYSIVANSLDTNDISSAFYTWIDGQGGGGGDVFASSNNVFTGTNTFTGPITGNVFSVSTLILANPIGLTAIGTNLADAQDELQLTPGAYTMAYDLDLLQLATMTWSNGVMAYHNGSTITNLVSTTTGRSLLTASSATNGRDVLEVGKLSQTSYNPSWNGTTNETATLDAIYDVIAALPGGSNSIVSWNTNYFSVTGGYLDWVGGSTGGGGVTWIGTSGLGAFTNLTTATNVTLGAWTISSNDVPSQVGRYLVGESVFMLTNNSGGTVNFHLSAKVNGTPVLSSQRSITTSVSADWQVARFRLSRESATTGTFYFDSERFAGSSGLQIGEGGGSFSSTGGGLIVVTNVPITWSTNFTFSLDIGQISLSAITNDWAGTRPVSASLYNPGDGSSGGGSGTNLVFTVNGVTFSPVIITNSATVTWATNANGHIQATAAGGGGGAGTNIFVNNVLIQPAKLTNSTTVTWSTNANGDIVATAATVTNSPVSGLWQTLGSFDFIADITGTEDGTLSFTNYSGIVTNAGQIGNDGSGHRLQLQMTFNQDIGTNYLVFYDFDSADDELSEFGSVAWAQTSARLGTSCEVSIVDNGGTTFSQDGRKGRIRIINPNATAGGGGGGGTNWASGSTIARFTAIQGEPPASTYATFSTRNSLGVLDYDPATDEAARFRFIIPAGYSLTNATVVVHWTTTATSGNAVWQARFWKLTGSDIDSDSFGPAVTQTTACSATAGTVVTSTITPVGLDDATASQEVAMEITRLGSSGSDTINSNDLNLLSVEVRTP